jgi:hypothetical protein
MGTINHLFCEYMQNRLISKWTTVQYKGIAPAMSDLGSLSADMRAEYPPTKNLRDRCRGLVV